MLIVDPTTLDKAGLYDLACGLDPAASDHAAAKQRCIEFVLAETLGHWHNRARAMMCRRLKHCALTPAESRQLADAITARLAAGKIPEQFRDQLRLALHLDPQRTLEAAHSCLASRKEYIRRFATWAILHRTNPENPSYNS
ncbi:MAG TPA: hypothetical protein VGN17_07340 [Bryobacteraceae bacterium]|jgi:hypothetical protein